MAGHTAKHFTVLAGKGPEGSVSRKSVVLFVCWLLSLSLSSTARPQSQHALTAAEHARALSIEEAEYSERSPVRGGVPGLSETPRGARGETYVVSVAPIGSPSTVARVREVLRTDSLPNRRAQVTRYEYATGFTIRTWIDLDSGKVLAVRNDINYPTPLAPKELENAIALMPSRDDGTDAVATDDDNTLQYSHLVPVSGDMTEPRYGHRLVWLWIDSPERSAKYLVDLTMNEVVESR